MGLGDLLQDPFPAPRRPEQDPSTRQGDPLKQETRKDRAPSKHVHPKEINPEIQQSIDQNILERHQKRTACELSD